MLTEVLKLILRWGGSRGWARSGPLGPAGAFDEHVDVVAGCVGAIVRPRAHTQGFVCPPVSARVSRSPLGR